MKVLKFLFLVCCLIKGNEGARENVVADVILRFYNGNTLTQFIDTNLPNAVALLDEADFNVASPTIIYVHGFNEYAEIESVRVVISAHLDMFPNSNIILLDWANMAGGDYFGKAAPNTKLVAAAAAAEIKTLVNGGLNLQGIHLVGHSLGGHVVGFMGRILTGYNMKLNRITSLDPAYPGFYPGFILGHILASDAYFVDIIHTDAGLVGAPVSTGTADFWPNGGTSVQPGCLSPDALLPFVSCSHFRSWWYWAESVRYPSTFASVPYTSWNQFKLESHKKNKPINYMGIKADVTKAGNFYLQTKSKSLFGKGIAGTVFALI